MKKLTITVDDDVYKNLYAHIGRGQISRFLNDMARDSLSNVSDKNQADAVKKAIMAMAGTSTVSLTTDEIMQMTRDY